MDDSRITLVTADEQLRKRFESAWIAGQPVPLEEYRKRFPRVGALDLVSGSLVESADDALDPTLTFSARGAMGGLSSLADAKVHRQLRSVFRHGLLLNDRYELKRELGRGGMGLVFLGHDHRLDRPVAVKVLRPSPHHRPPEHKDRLQVMFAEEARLGASLLHPAIATVCLGRGCLRDAGRKATLRVERSTRVAVNAPRAGAAESAPCRLASRSLRGRLEGARQKSERPLSHLRGLRRGAGLPFVQSNQCTRRDTAGSRRAKAASRCDRR